MIKALQFKLITNFERGTLHNLLIRSYTGSLYENDENINHKWANYDNEAYDNPQTVGKCAFITVMNENAIGFASWDPRQKPLGIIGHNCILPEYRGNGYGKQQILEILRILKGKGFTRLKVTTVEHPFFISAQNMYLSCGFKEVRRGQHDDLPQCEFIEYRQEL